MNESSGAKIEKIVMISRLLPETNYTRYLCRSLNKINGGSRLVVYADVDERNDEIKDCGFVKMVWRRDLRYIGDIFRQIMKERPSVVHFQQEMNMFGGVLTAVFFPVLLFLTKAMGIKIVTTIHAVVEKNIINSRFIRLFGIRSFIVSPFSLKLFFRYLNKSIAFFSNKIIVHTKMLKNVLVDDYGVNKEKVAVIPHIVPVVKKEAEDLVEPYFLYFGYMARRKGIKKMIEGFSSFALKAEKKYKLVLVGGVIKGQEFAKDEIITWINKSRAKDCFEIRGFVGQDEIGKLFSGAYAVLIPAVVSFSASGPLAQVFAYGKCALVSDVGNFKEEVKNGVDAILVADNKWEESLEKVANDFSLVKRIEKGAETKAKERSEEIIAQKHLKLYENIIDNNS